MPVMAEKAFLVAAGSAKAECFITGQKVEKWFLFYRVNLHGTGIGID